MPSCSHCGYSFINESQSPEPRTFYSCPRCGKVMIPPARVGKQNESQPDKEQLPYKTLIEHDFSKDGGQ